MSAQVAKQIVHDALEGAGLPAPFVKLALVPLQQPGRILCDEEPSRWSRLIEASCIASGGNRDFVPHVIAAFEVCIAALDVLDEIEDEDQSPLAEQVGAPRALNVASALLNIAYVILHQEAAASPGNDIVVDLCRLLAETVISATVGQDQDLANDGNEEITVDQALTIARLKSGSLVGGACRLGARLGTSDAAILAAYGEFGLHFGTMSQIANDMHDIEADAIKSDQKRQSATLPLIYLRHLLRDHSGGREQVTLQDSGALHFSWTVFETERMRCQSILSRLRASDQHVELLVKLLGD